MTAPTPPTDKPALRSVTIALDILDAFFADAEIGLSELARRVGVTKSTMHRTCGVLVSRGALERTATGKYQLGVHLLEYGQLVTTRSALRAQALPLLVELRNSIGETVQLGVPAGADVLYIERVEGLGALRFTTEAFRRSPVHRSSTGKAIAAFRPEVAAARIKAGMKPSTGHTIVIPQMFLDELARIRERGYAISIDESEIGLSSIGVPVRSHPDGEVIAAISTAGPTGRLLGDHETHHVRLMLNAARQLTNALAAGTYTLPRQRRGA
ncbi:MAG TPA: IclR family transcriptional regulator [Ilumatobacteraceae bacterium]